MEQELYFKLFTIICLSLALLGLMSTSIYSNIYANYVGTLMWGSHGSGPAQFYFPLDVAVDSSGNVFVVDFVNNRIQKFQLADPCPTGTQGNNGVCFVIEWRNYLGLGSVNFSAPQAVAVDSSGNVFVADSGRNHILKFQLANPCPSGTTLVPSAPGVCFVLEWGSPWPGIPGASIGQFAYPGGLAVDSSGNVFVADTFNDRIQKFQLADPCPTGTTQVPGFPGVCYIIKWGGPGAGNGKFQYPRHIAVDSSGNVFVADLYNDRIQKFQLADPCPGGTTQVDPGACYITEWGYGGALACILARTFVCHSPPNQFEGPYGIAVDSSGNVFVADYWADRIHKFIDDIIPPTVTITYPINGATLTHNLPPPHRTCIICPTLNVTNPINVPAINVLPRLEIRATATDNVEVKKVEFYASSTSGNYVLVGTDTSSPYSVPLTNLAPDTYTLTVKAYDTADNTKISTPVTISIK